MKSNYSIKREGGLAEGAEPHDIITRFEKVRVDVYGTEDEGAEKVARQVVEGIKSKEAEGGIFVLGITTGKSPLGIYRKLQEKYRAGEVSFANVAVFSLDEFYPIRPEQQQSRYFRLHEELLNHIDIKPENVHFPDSQVPVEEISQVCAAYEDKINEYGGIDLILLGTGEQGQVGINEAGSFFNSRTRLVALGNDTLKSFSSMFFGIGNIPKKAITMGLRTIREARKIVIVAWGEQKASIVKAIAEGELNTSLPATSLQLHRDLTLVVDEGAAEELTRYKTPWLVGTCDWQPKFIRKAVIWLCKLLKKPVLKLTYQDYVDNHLGQLLEAAGKYDQINIKVFNDLQHTITGWPGGKPNADDSTRPETASPFPKRIIIFSPHPDDDVISMGGTFLRLVEQGHEVYVAYQTSGNIAVHDDVVLQTLDTIRECGFGDHYAEAESIIAGKKEGQPEPWELRKLKGAIRRAEAKAACRVFGLDPQTNVRFLNLPFYETGGIQKGVITGADIKIISDLLEEIKPHRIFAAGDLSDPHGTHRMCIEALLDSVSEVRDREWFEGCRLWLYRGAWQEWDLDMVDMAVPLSPDEVIKKRHAIYRHLSQKDNVPFPGEDTREFWQRAEERTEHTAKMYDKLGMAEYQAMEVFVRLF